MSDENSKDPSGQPEQPPAEPAALPGPRAHTGGNDISNRVMVPTPQTPGLQQVQIPEVLPLMPIRGAVVFPGAVMPLSVGRDKSKRLLDDVLPNEKIIGVITQKNDAVEDPGPSDLYQYGTAALVLKMVRTPDGHQSIILHGLVRFKVLEMVAAEPYMKARVQVLPDAAAPDTPDFKLLVSTVREAAGRMIQLSPNIPDEAVQMLNNIEHPGTLTDFLAANLAADVAEKQAILEEVDLAKRLERVRERLVARIDVLEVQEKIQNQVRSSIDNNQRQYFLREQLKAIQKELGQEDPADAEVQELKRKLDEAKLPEGVKKETDRELQRLSSIPQASPEFGVIRTLLETVAELPWSKSTTDNLDIKNARHVLDRDHYDLDKIKQRIIEYLAVRKLNPTGKGPILCFVGPPGVGKTSLGKSIAESLGRNFVRVSLGGVRDEADIRGHRRTYIGALPGRIIQEIRKAGSNNPVMMLDEVDKLGSDFRGDPSSALLEVLDPEQNNTFTDHYLALPFDLSRVIFICTANYLDAVPGPLRDRMEIIDVPGYVQQDKLLIAKRYLVPRQLKEHGLSEKQLKLPNKTLEAIIDQYTREAGVRGLNRTIASVVRGVAAKIAEAMQDNGKLPEITEAQTVAPEDLSRYLGPAKFESELAQRTSTPGVVTGLAWTPVGGEILFVEATQMPGRGALQLTGQIGAVMKESVQIAFSLLKNHAQRLGLDRKVFFRTDVHVHVPAGAVPKDGPSAGTAMYTALASLFLNKAARPDVAMTGEVTLRGLVLPVGGVKEKVIAAKRAGIKTVILPKRNEKDLVEIPDDAKKGLTFHFADHVDRVLQVALGVATAAAEKPKAIANGQHGANGNMKRGGRREPLPAKKSIARR